MCGVRTVFPRYEIPSVVGFGLAVALLMFRDMVMCPRKGYFSVLFDEENCLVGSPFAFFIQGHSTNRPAPKLKSVGDQPFGSPLGAWEMAGRSRRSETPQAAIENSLT